MWMFCLCVYGRSMGSGCSMWGRGTRKAWRATWCRWTAPGWNCQPPQTAESLASTGPTACKDSADCKWADTWCYIDYLHFLSHTNKEFVLCWVIYLMSKEWFGLLLSSLVLLHWRGEDKCLQGLANATVTGMTSHTTCMYWNYSLSFSVYILTHCVFLCCVISC